MLRISIRELSLGSLAVAIAIGWFVEHRRLGAAKGAVATANAKAASFEKLELANANARTSSRDDVATEIRRVNAEVTSVELVSEGDAASVAADQIAPYPSTGVAMLDPIRVRSDSAPVAARRQFAANLLGKVDESLVGRYYQGDGLGFNLYLDLAGDGTFECEWRGCLGIYASTAGKWSRHDDRLFLTPSRAEGSFAERPIGDMTILILEGEERLVLDKDLLEFRDDAERLLRHTFVRQQQKAE